MPAMNEVVRALGSREFDDVLKQAILAIDPAQLPLQQGLVHGSHALTDKLGVTILGSDVNDGAIQVRVGLFYTSIIAGCSCADDPTPVDEMSEYCGVEIDIDRRTGEATISVSD